MKDKVTRPIAFNRPTFTGKEFDYLELAFTCGHAAGDGRFTKQCNKLLESILGVPKVLLTTSCTHALEMAALLLNIQTGDEVIVPSFTFVTTVNSFVLRGACPIFIDIRPDTLNLDETQLERLISPHTKAIVPVHYAGVGCEMDTITKIARAYGIAIVEDNAHGLFAKYKGQYLGTWGALATQSFHETKNFTCGEGGALLINAPEYMERAEIIREKGTDRSRFFRGEVDKYGWVDVGSSYLPSDLLAAILYAQLEERERIQAHRKWIWHYYHEHLRCWAAEQSIRLPVVPPYCEQSYHMFYLLLPTQEQRQQLITHLKERGIASVFHYLPLHLSKMGRRFGGQDGDCPITETVSECLLRLPFHNALGEAELVEIVSAIKEFSVSK